MTEKKAPASDAPTGDMTAGLEYVLEKVGIPFPPTGSMTEDYLATILYGVGLVLQELMELRLTVPRGDSEGVAAIHKVI